MSEELKPCPFCGGKAEFVPIEASRDIGVVCSRCKAAMFHSWIWIGQDKDCITAWNTRVEQKDVDA